MFKETPESQTHSYEDDCCFNHAQLDAYAMENVEIERQRIHGILSRMVAMKEPITQEDLSKLLLGNRK